MSSDSPGIGNGSYLVGRDIQAGSYHTVYVVRDCYWERSTSSGDIIANDAITYAPGEVHVTLNGGEAFTTRQCGRWELDPPPPPPASPSPPSVKEIAASKKAAAAEKKYGACIDRQYAAQDKYDKAVAKWEKSQDKGPSGIIDKEWDLVEKSLAAIPDCES